MIQQYQQSRCRVNSMCTCSPILLYAYLLSFHVLIPACAARTFVAYLRLSNSDSLGPFQHEAFSTGATRTGKITWGDT